jgi:hypothetical protein
MPLDAIGFLVILPNGICIFDVKMKICHETPKTRRILFDADLSSVASAKEDCADYRCFFEIEKGSCLQYCGVGKF